MLDPADYIKRTLNDRQTLNCNSSDFNVCVRHKAE